MKNLLRTLLLIVLLSATGLASLLSPHPDNVDLFRQGNFEAALSFTQSGFQEPDFNRSLLVKQGRGWRRLWFHVNTNPQLFWLQNTPILIVKECIPFPAEEGECVPSDRFTTAHDFRTQTVTVGEVAVRKLVAQRPLIEAQPRWSGKLGFWIWQDVALKRAL